ncbi:MULTISPECIES: dipeptidase [Sphingomonas]|uniref:dipeptidase n=1 Tax=Sphingomonas TaxID=13687 RepID=UPI000DEF60A2|nr:MULTISPECIES: dipeptidase [Sphingomonas]
MRTLLALAAAALAATPAVAQPIAPAVAKRIDRILRQTPLIDGHNDLPEQLRENYKLDVSGLASGTDTRAHPLMTDMARLRAGRVGGVFWSVYIDGSITGNQAIHDTIEQIDTVHRLVAAYPNDLAFARTADDVVRIHRQGKIASLIGIEGGRQIGGSLAALRLFYDAGARYMTLTHNQTTEWADSATDEPRWHGLSPFGLQVIGEMNRLGMLVDLSHVSAETMKAAIAASKAPVIFSHSSARALNTHPRNVTDDVLRLLPANGGVVMVNWVPPFINQRVLEWQADEEAATARLKQLNKGNQAAVDAGVKAWESAHPRPATTVAIIADHIDHVARVAGHDHVGIGADLDGIPYTPDGMTGVDAYPLLFAELIRRGWSDTDLAKLAGGNVLRALRGAEETARRLKDQPPAMATLEAAPTAP